LTQEIPVAAASLFSGQAGNLVYGNLDGSPLLLPCLVFPYLRCLYYMAYHAYGRAMTSKRPHYCAEATNPSEEIWEEIKKAVISNSECADDLLFEDSTGLDETHEFEISSN